MATVPLFRDTNMAAVTSREKNFMGSGAGGFMFC